MAEKRRSGLPATAESKPGRGDSDEELLCHAGVGALLRAALLKLVETRPEDPLGFLAEHFGNAASAPGNGPSAGGDGDAEQQQLGRALWHLSLAHHSQRSAFNSNTRMAYDLLMQGSPRHRGPGGVRGRVYTELLRGLCTEGGLSDAAAAPLLRRLHCHDHEAVPFDLFRQAALTCVVFADYVRKSQGLYAAVSCHPERPAKRVLCQAVLGTLREALETSGDSARYLEASAKISPCKVAQAMAEACSRDKGGARATMDAQEFEDAAAELFLARVRVVC
ncbi:tubulin polyglutamylase complex subunit 1 [Denticeps clupeoides]|uniref:Tubulin polyglutamylase complex subunit 1-like C-terminal domain-containing protein n=1 Tax=Denticeps clupeoides TaxID=299321 RepID=A0AAY4AU51_9TELE|nr:tubulin polyglutamylase complex subunit 1 [Denticeps clupeoides]